jgi:hypothetical protein
MTEIDSRPEAANPIVTGGETINSLPNALRLE